MDQQKIVVVGGGTGNHITLTGLKHDRCDLTAVVAMTDSGGSSGRLREELVQVPLLSAGVYLRHDPHAFAKTIMGIPSNVALRAGPSIRD